MALESWSNWPYEYTLLRRICRHLGPHLIDITRSGIDRYPSGCEMALRSRNSDARSNISSDAVAVALLIPRRHARLPANHHRAPLTTELLERFNMSLLLLMVQPHEREREREREHNRRGDQARNGMIGRMLGLDWIDNWIGLDWIGLDWIGRMLGLDWIGLDWIGLVGCLDWIDDWIGLD